MKIPRIAILVILSHVFAAGLHAQAQPEFQIWGRVVLPEGYFSRQVGLEVRLERPGRLFVNSIVTDEDGRFQFRNLEEGEYFLYINLEGYSAVLQQVIVRRPTQVNPTVTIHLRRGAGDSTIDGTRKEAPGKPAEKTGRPQVVDAATLAKFPQKVLREYEQALKESDSGKFDKASERLRKLVAAAPDFYEAQMQFGIALQRTAKYKDAESAFTRARAINPKAAQPMINTAGVYLDRARIEGNPGLYPDVVKLAEDAIEADPDSTEAHYYLGSALFKLDRLTEAEDALRRALLTERPFEEARLMLVNVYMKQRRHREALGELDQYLEANPASPQRKAIEGMQAQIRKALNL